MEYTLLLIKPDAVKAGAQDKILHALSDAGLCVILRRSLLLTAGQVEHLYDVHKDKIFFTHLKGFMTSGPSEVCIIKGDDAINRLNEICGHNDPQKAVAGTIRRIYGTGKSENAVHSSANQHSFYTELQLLLQVRDISTLLTLMM